MSLVDQIKTLLIGAGTPFKAVSGAAGLAAAQHKGPLALPAAYVFFGREASAENQRATGTVSQRQERDLSIVIIVDNATDAIGEAGADELETIKTWLRGKLVGYEPTGNPSGDPITHVQGDLVDFESGRVWYEDVYSAPTYLVETTP